jgi:hypothetical protein
MINLHRPYKLERRVMLEKSGNNRYVVIKRTRDIKLMKLKRSISILICIVSSILISYSTSCIMSLNFNIINWLSGERFALLLFSFIGLSLLFPYCRYHITDAINGRNEEFKISFLSENWFKKLLSVFIIYFFVIAIFYIVFCFCSMSFDISNMNYILRVILSILIYIITIGLCVQAYNNNLKTILKIENI